MSSHLDLVIVGAGPQGLCAAHTFLSIDPSLKLVIIDDKDTIGGVWAEEQVYPGLRANNAQGWFEFSDFPILEADLGDDRVTPRGPLSGRSLSAYFTQYAKHFDLERRINLRTRVVKATREGSQAEATWSLLITTTGSEGMRTQSRISCTKLVVATGQASQPLLPSIAGITGFERPVIHTASLGQDAPGLLDDKSISHVTVLGGSKSAHDAVHMFATAGKHVTWLCRKGGRGPTPMANTYTRMGPWSVWLEGLLMTRSLSWFGPAPWSTGEGFGWIRWLLHSTSIGRWLMRGYWAGLSQDSLAQSGILKDLKTESLVPNETLMWYGTQANMLNYEPEFYSVIGGQNVEVIREGIEHIETGTLILTDGRGIQPDILICATGYQFGPSFTIETRGKLLSLGVPVDPESDDMYPPLEAKADAELFERFPELKSSPASKERQPGLTPWRLWRFIAPPSEVCSTRSLAFLNTITCYQTTLKCELTSLWAYAYLFDELSVKPSSEEDARYEATLWSRFGKWSRPVGMQGKIADFFMDSMPYYDLLLRDLGLRNWRKGWGIIGEVFGRWYELKDYRGIVEEWKRSRQIETKKLR